MLCSIILCDFVTEKEIFSGYTKIKKIKERLVTDMSAKVINKNNFNEVLESDKKVLLDFFASWCGPCRMLSPVIDKIADEHPEFLVGKINVDEEEELAMKFGVSSIPALFVIENGKIVNQSLGAMPEQGVLALLES